ncbi:MAG: SLC26A/SulP transporter family protein [Rhodocyclaceae bacterium]|nr:SLC26A/SulP transporter family protein [Rhodocyclaceae bacterium]
MNLLAGFTVMMIGLPIELNYGLIAFSRVEGDLGALGIRAALIGAMVAGIVSALAGTRAGQMPGSRPAVMLVVADAMHVLAQMPLVSAGGSPVPLLAGLALLTLMAGGLQVAFAVAGLGKAIKFIPYPVLAGISLGVALVVLKLCIPPMLGLSYRVGWADLWRDWSLLRPASVVVALATAAVALRPPAFARRVPPTLTAIVVGVLVHFLLAGILGPDRLGPLTGDLGTVLPAPPGAEHFRFVEAAGIAGLAATLFPFAAAMAVLASIEALVSATAADTLTHQRHDSNRELRAQGLGNMAAAVCGGSMAAPTMARVRAALDAGARSPVATAAYGLSILFAGGLFGHWLGRMPIAVVASVLAVLAVNMVDPWSRRVIRQTLFGRGELDRQQWEHVAVNFAVLVLVAAVVLVGNMMQAVVVGVFAAMFVFVRTSTRPAVRRIHSGVVRRSNKVRTAAERALLDTRGDRIRVVEFDGPLFFGNADRLYQEVERLGGEADIVILDFRRTTDVDATGARIVEQLAHLARVRGKLLLISHIHRDDRIGRTLLTFGFSTTEAASHWFADTDGALEAAEDRIVAADGPTGGAGETRYALHELPLFAGMAADQLEVLREYLHERRVGRGENLFRAGDPGDELFITARGTVTLRAPAGEGTAPGPGKRLTMVPPGVVFGEMAFIEGKPRSADAVADDEVMLYALKRDAFEEIRQVRPDIATTLLFNIGRELSGRLRLTTDALRSALD